MNWLAYSAIFILQCFVIETYGQQLLANTTADKPPEDCNMNPREALDSYSTVRDFDRCAPYSLPLRTMLYYRSGAGNEVTLRDNKMAFSRLQIQPKILVDVSKIDMTTTVMGRRISMPIAASPSAFHKLASERGEIDTVRAVSKAGTIMTLSSLSTSLVEDVAAAAVDGAILWMQIYFFTNRSITANIIRRAEASGFKAFAVTVDTPIFGPLPVDATTVLEENKPNSGVMIMAFELPLTLSLLLNQVEGAIRAVKCGASGILVSNHGARQLDYVPATIDALPKIVAAMKNCYPSVEVYMDGGVRSGADAFKALGLGARVVFVGRPVLWGLAVGGERGVTKVFKILKKELNETMMLAGTPRVDSIKRNMITKHPKCECSKSEDPQLPYADC